MSATNFSPCLGTSGLAAAVALSFSGRTRVSSVHADVADVLRRDTEEEEVPPDNYDFLFTKEPDNLDFLFTNETNFSGEDFATWDTAAVTSMEEAFSFSSLSGGGSAGSISGWNTGKVGNFKGTFRRAIMFDDNIGPWDVSSATTMAFMFRGSWSFHQDLSGWDTAKVHSMQEIFVDAFAFDKNYIQEWNVTFVTDNDDLKKMEAGVVVVEPVDAIDINRDCCRTDTPGMSCPPSYQERLFKHNMTDKNLPGADINIRSPFVRYCEATEGSCGEMDEQDSSVHMCSDVGYDCCFKDPRDLCPGAATRAPSGTVNGIDLERICGYCGPEHFYQNGITVNGIDFGTPPEVVAPNCEPPAAAPPPSSCSVALGHCICDGVCPEHVLDNGGRGWAHGKRTLMWDQDLCLISETPVEFECETPGLYENSGRTDCGWGSNNITTGGRTYSPSFAACTAYNSTGSTSSANRYKPRIFAGLLGAVWVAMFV